MPQEAAADHHTFGRHIATRRLSFMYAVVGAIFCALAIVALLCACAIAIDGDAVTNPLREKVVAFFLLMAISAGLAWGGWIIGRRSFERFHYFERGLLATRFSRDTCALAYADTARLFYNVARQYYNGIYIGSVLTICLTDTKGKELSFSGRYKEKPKGFGFTILHKKFEGEDEMDVVKLIIAEAVADRLVERMEREGSVEWAAKVRLSPVGVTPPSGKRKKQEVPYEKIVSVLPKDGFLHLFHEGEERSFIGVPFNAENSWPGLVVWQRMMAAAHPQAHEEASAPLQAQSA